MSTISFVDGVSVSSIAAFNGISLSSLASILGIDKPASGLTNTPGTPSVFESANSSYISCTALSSSQALVCYRDGGNSSYGTACILNVSGSTITPGTPSVFESANSSYISCTALSSSQALVCYIDGGNSNYGTACILNVSGSTITPGTPSVFESAPSYYIACTALSSSQALACYIDGGNSNYGTACILNISSSTITPGTPSVFESAASSYISCTTLSSSQALACYLHEDDSGYGAACILNVSGSTITPGTPSVFESAPSYYIACTALSSSQALACYIDGGNSNYGTACILNVSGSTITPGTPSVFESANSSYISCTALSSSQALVCYIDGGNSSYGTACIIN